MIGKRLLIFLILAPLSQLWESVYRLRRALFEYGLLKKSVFKVPVVSIGNITFGGTGKTPITIWLSELFESYGMKVMILTRGYKGDLEHKSGLVYGGQLFRSNPQELGDEPLLMARRMKEGAVVIGKRRSENLRQYFPKVDPDVVLLDDGFQHLELHRSFNIVLFDAILPIERYKTAPLGYLREGKTSLRDADAILIGRHDQVSEQKIDELLEFIKPHARNDVVIGRFHYRPKGLYDSYYQHQMKLGELEGRKVVALTALASPEYFYRMLENAGLEIIQKHAFADHHFFESEEIEKILIEAVREDTFVITSEKDMVKIRRLTHSERILFLQIDVQFAQGEDMLLKKLKEKVHL